MNKMMLRRLYAYQLFVFLASILCMQSCKKSVQMNDEGVISEFVVEIRSSAGETLVGFEKYDVPTFFNYGKMKFNDKELDFIVLGPSVSESSSLLINHLGTLEFEKEGQKIQWHLAEPKETNNVESTEIDDEVKLMNYQSSIESWIRMQCPSDMCRNFKWRLPMHMYKELDD